MTNRTSQCGLILIFYFMKQTMSYCEGPYSNMCGYYENILNKTEIDDTAESICVCQQLKFCFLIELFKECNSTIVKLGTDGNFTFSNQIHCEILPVDHYVKAPTYEFLNQTENEIIINILTDLNVGKYKIICSVSENFNEFNVTIDDKWEVERVDPMEVKIDSEVELQLTITRQVEMNSYVWCFVKTPDNTTEVLSASWVLETQIHCIGFKPVIPGEFKVSLSSVITFTFDEAICVKVISKRPVAEKAEYSSDFEIISIYFDENIELYSTCANVFSKEDLKNFGRDFDCFTRGDALVVKMGSQFQLVNNISISPGNKICRAGSSSTEHCLSAPPVNLVVSKYKLLGSSVSLFTNPACGNASSQNYMNVKIISPKYSNPVIQNHILEARSSGKTQRKNLILWRLMRKIQSKFSPPLNIPQTNATEILPLLENLSSFDTLGDGQKSLGSATVSVFLQSSPGSASVVAEATVIFCEKSVKLYWFKWIVNGEDLFENGKLLILKDLSPGKYIIKCLVVAYNSSEILGQSWTTTEILPKDQKVIITPAEITAGTADIISFRAVTWPGSSASWTCKTKLHELCTTRDKKLASDVLDLTSPNISIPAGTFPVGDYVWTIKNAQGANTAKIFIKPGNRTAVDVDTSLAFVKSSEEIVLRGFVKRAQRDCHAWWSPVRQKGFSYLNLNNVGEREKISNDEKFPVREIDLVISPPSENWKGIESNTLYMFKLQVFCPQGANSQTGFLDFIKVPLIVADPPRVSPLIVEPLEGAAMMTNFELSGGEAEAHVSGPLIFEWSYVDSCNAEVLIKRGAFARNFTTYLPPGDLKLKLRVCNENEICTTTSTSVIYVIQESEFPGENFQNALNQIQVLMTSGDILEAFGLAITVFKSLALLPETKFREMIFSVVEVGIKFKIKDLTERMQSNSKSAKLSLEFFERAIAVTKYFRKNSDILIQLVEFKDSILRILNSKNVNEKHF